MKKYNLLILLLLLIFFLPVYSQRQPDLGMWNTFSIEKVLTKRYSVAIDEEVRLRENITRLNLMYTNFSFIVKPAKGLKVGLTYRSIQKYTELNYFSFRHRLMLDISYKYKLNDFVFTYRSRFQTEVKNYYTSELGQIPEWFWRNKFDIKYKFGNFVPYIGIEYRYQLNDPRNPCFNYGWHRYRTYFGLDYDINNSNSVGVYYLIQREFDVIDPEIIYILGVQYSIVLD